MSKQALKQQESTSNKGDLEADFLLNKHVFRTCAYSAAGFGVGLAASLLFFKHKAAMTAFFAGSGAGYGIAGFTSDYSHYRRYKSWIQNQTQRGGQRESGRPSVRDFDGFVANQFAQSQRGQERSSQQRDDNRQQERSVQQRDDRGQDRSSQNRSDNQGQQKQDQQRRERDQWSDNRQDQQGKQGGQSQQGGKQQSQQQHGKEEPMSAKAQQRQDIANQKPDPQAGKPEPRMGQVPHPGHATQDKAKKVENAVYSQTNQGSQHSLDEHQAGQKGPQNSTIPPSQRDWTGGHASQAVHPGQVHRGRPEEDKMGKSNAPSSDPKKEQDKTPSKQENQALSNVDLKGQKLQTFQSNPQPLGKAGPTHEIKKDYQEGRNRADDPNLDNQRRHIKGLEQDRMGQSVKEGNNIRVRDRSDTEAGVGNYRVGVAEQNTKNQVNATLE